MISAETAVKAQSPGSPIRHHQHRHNVNSRYEFIKTLGKGTYGKVKLARHKETNQLMAVKSIRKEQVKDSVDMRQIRREMEIMSSISHQHIIQIYEVFENLDKIVIVMEYAAGGELYDYLAAKSGVSDEEARGFFRQIVSAVRYCHHQGIVHRDLKLENILLDKENRIKIADFGLANSFKPDHFLQTFCGSPLYASPEIVCGVPYKGPEVDSWSLGVLLYALVYGTMPFDGRNYQLLTKQITSGVFTKPPRQSAAYGLICWMLTVDPRQRATINDVATHPWVGLEPENLLRRNAVIPTTSRDVTVDGELVVPSNNTQRQIRAPKSILKHKLLPSRPHSVPNTPNMGDTLADQLAAVCGLNTKDSLILKSSNITNKRGMLRSKHDRESGYYSSPERAQRFHDNVSASEPTLTGIGETVVNQPAPMLAERASWPGSSDHSSSLPSGMSTCGLTDTPVKKHRCISLSSDDDCSVGSCAQPSSTYSDSSVLSTDSVRLNCSPKNHSIPLDTLPQPRPEDLEKQPPGSLTPNSEKLVRELERILAPSGRRRMRQGVRGLNSIPPVSNSPPLVISDFNENFKLSKDIDPRTKITLAEVSNSF